MTNQDEVFRFLVSGLTAVITDFPVYYLLLCFVEHNLSKGISFLSAAFVVYIIIY